MVILKLSVMQFFYAVPFLDRDHLYAVIALTSIYTVPMMVGLRLYEWLDDGDEGGSTIEGAGADS